MTGEERGERSRKKKRREKRGERRDCCRERRADGWSTQRIIERGEQRRKQRGERKREERRETSATLPPHGGGEARAGEHGGSLCFGQIA